MILLDSTCHRVKKCDKIPLGMAKCDNQFASHTFCSLPHLPKVSCGRLWLVTKLQRVRSTTGSLSRFFPACFTHTVCFTTVHLACEMNWPRTIRMREENDMRIERDLNWLQVTALVGCLACVLIQHLNLIIWLALCTVRNQINDRSDFLGSRSYSHITKHRVMYNTEIPTSFYVKRKGTIVASGSFKPGLAQHSWKV